MPLCAYTVTHDNAINESEINYMSISVRQSQVQQRMHFSRRRRGENKCTQLHVLARNGTQNLSKVRNDICNST